MILVGEIRDQETAEIAVQAALTGHLVLTTLHTNDAPSTVSRLIDMGIEPFLAASTILCIVAQRLGRRLQELQDRDAQGRVPHARTYIEMGYKPEEVEGLRH